MTHKPGLKMPRDLKGHGGAIGPTGSHRTAEKR